MAANGERVPSRLFLHTPRTFGLVLASLALTGHRPELSNDPTASCGITDHDRGRHASSPMLFSTDARVFATSLGARP